MEIVELFADVLGLSDILSGIMAIIAIPMIIWNMLLCLFGYKLFKIQLMITGFLFGGVLGAVIGAAGGAGIAVLIALAMGVFFAWVAVKLYEVGVFIAVSLTTTAILIMLIGLLSGDFSGGTVVVSVILGIAMGVVGVILDKLVIVLYTAISGGLCTGFALAAAMGQPVLGIVIGTLLAILGVWLQFRMEKKDGVAVDCQPNKVKQSFAEHNFLVDNVANSITESAKDVTAFIAGKLDKKANINSNQNILVSSKGNYWTSGMPMLVTETQIVNQGGDENNVFLNIGIQNLSEQPILGFYFDVACYDLLKNELERISDASFLDLSIEQGKTWFSSKSICLPNKTTRKCVVTIKNVVLQNEEIWANETYAPLQELAVLKSLSLISDLAQEYYTEIEEHQKVRNAKGLHCFTPRQEQGYWCCSCGQINIGVKCVLCGLEKDYLFTIFDTSRLQQQMEYRIAEKVRLEEERRKHIEEQTEAVKQNLIFLGSRAKSKSQNLLLWFKRVYISVREQVRALYTKAKPKLIEYATSTKVSLIKNKKQIIIGCVGVLFMGASVGVISAFLSPSDKSVISAAVSSSSNSTENIIDEKPSAPVIDEEKHRYKWAWVQEPQYDFEKLTVENYREVTGHWLTENFGAEKDFWYVADSHYPVTDDKYNLMYDWFPVLKDNKIGVYDASGTLIHSFFTFDGSVNDGEDPHDFICNIEPCPFSFYSTGGPIDNRLCCDETGKRFYVRDAYGFAIKYDQPSATIIKIFFEDSNLLGTALFQETLGGLSPDRSSGGGEAKLGYINSDGVVTVKPQYFAFDHINDELITFKDSNGLWAIFSVDGEQLTDFLYDAPPFEQESFILVVQDEQYGYLDIELNEIIPLEFDDATPVTYGRCWVKQDGLWGILRLIDTQEEQDEYLSTDWKIAYLHLLNDMYDYYDKIVIEDMGFYCNLLEGPIYLMDIDRNGIPELTFGERYGDGPEMYTATLRDPQLICGHEYDDGSAPWHNRWSVYLTKESTGPRVVIQQLYYAGSNSEGIFYAPFYGDMYGNEINGFVESTEECFVENGSDYYEAALDYYYELNPEDFEFDFTLSYNRGNSEWKDIRQQIIEQFQEYDLQRS